MHVKLFLLMGAAAFVTVGAGCSSTTASPPVPAQASQATPAMAPATTSPTATSSASSSSVSEVVCSIAESRIRLLSSGYSLVDASRGAGDHQTLTRGFYEDAKDFSEDMEDDGCTDLLLPALELTMEAAILQAAVAASGEAESDDYAKAATAGQTLMKAAGITDEEFGSDPLGN